MDFVLFFGMSFNNKWYFLSQDNIFSTSFLQLIVLATKICPQGKKVLVHLETKVFYLWYLLQHRHINHAIVIQLYLQKSVRRTCQKKIYSIHILYGALFIWNKRFDASNKETSRRYSCVSNQYNSVKMRVLRNSIDIITQSLWLN